MKFKKKNLLWIGGFIFIFAFPLVTVLPIFVNKLEQKNLSWNIKKMEQKIESKSDFVAYIGTNKCPGCLNFGKELKKKERIEYLNKPKIKDLFLWFYSDQSVGGKEATKFFEDINNLIKTNQKIEKTTPQILFFKNKKLVDRWLPSKPPTPPQKSKLSELEIKKYQLEIKKYWEREIQKIKNKINDIY